MNCAHDINNAIGRRIYVPWYSSVLSLMDGDCVSPAIQIDYWTEGLFTMRFPPFSVDSREIHEEVEGVIDELRQV